MDTLPDNSALYTKITSTWSLTVAGSPAEQDHPDTAQFRDQDKRTFDEPGSYKGLDEHGHRRQGQAHRP